MFGTFFLVSGWFFWALILAVVIAEIATTEAESLGWSIAVMAAAFLVVALFSDADPVGWLRNNIVLTLIMIPVYFALGAGWALWKWKVVINDALEKYKEKEADYRLSWDKADKVDYPTFSDYVQRYYRVIPSAKENKERITTWIAFWPFSLLWAILTYPRKLVVFIYRQLLTTFERMANAAFAGKFD